MKSKRNVLVGAFLSIMLCVSVIAGATFALFTSEDVTNIVVKTANLSVTADATNLKTYSLSDTVEGKEVENEGSTFANGGVAAIDAKEGVVTLDKLTAGDRVSFDILVKNDSNVKIKYRTVIKTPYSGTELMNEKTAALMLALDVKTQVEGKEEQSYNGWTYESDWESIPARTETTTEETVHVSIGLPESATEELMNASVKFSYTVEAVQGNTPTTNVPDTEFRIYNEFDLRVLSEAVKTDDFAGKTVKVMGSFYGSRYPIAPIGDRQHPFRGSFISGTTGRVTMTNLNIVKPTVKPFAIDYGLGLFGCLGDGAVVKDIELRGAKYTTSADKVDENYFLCNIVGGVAGYSVGNVTIENVVVDSDTRIYGYGKVGGVIGMNESGDKLVLKDVKVWKVYLTGAYNIGGLVGLSLNGAPKTDNARVCNEGTVLNVVKTTGGQGGDYVNVDTTLADDSKNTVNGEFFRIYASGAYWLYSVKANLYTYTESGSAYTDKELANGYFVGDTAIVNNEGIVNGTLSSEPFAGWKVFK